MKAKTCILLAVIATTRLFAYDVKVGDLYYNLDTTNHTASITHGNHLIYSSIEYIIIPTEIYCKEIAYSVTSIGDGAFMGCNNLTSVTIPNSVTSIGEFAFEGCENLAPLTIPNSVTSIGESAFGRCDKLTSVFIPNSVTSIGASAFVGNTYVNIDSANKYYCSEDNIIYSKKKDIIYRYPSNKDANVFEIPNSVTIIGRSAFYNCDNLTSITIPTSVTSIGEFAFSGCKNLTSVTIPNSVTSIGEFAFEGCENLAPLTIPNSVTSIGEYAFFGCKNLTSVTIPNSVTSIGARAFNGNTYINIDSANKYYCSEDNIIYSKKKDIIYRYPSNKDANVFEIPSSVTSIGKFAFGFCKNLTSIIIPYSVTSIGENAFRFCDNLTSITIPSSVTSIGEDAFFGCKNLTSVTIPNSVTSIGASAFFGCKNLTSVTIPNSVTSIGASAFAWCNQLTSVFIPNSVTTISDCAFHSCDNLTSITIPSSVTSIGEYAFSGCKNLTSVTIPNSVTSIGESAFSYCKNLTSVTIPNSVTSIGESAFSYCKNLTSIFIPNSVTTIGNSAFSGCKNLTSVFIPHRVTSIGASAFDGNTYINIDSSNKYYCSDDNIIYSKNKDIIYRYPSNKDANVFEIPNSVTTIGNSAFYKCESLTSIIIPNSVTYIGEYAFSGCKNLTSVTIPHSVTYIGEIAFYDCKNLEFITYPKGLYFSKAEIPLTAKLIAYDPANPPTQVETPMGPASAISQSTPILPQCRINFPATNTTYNSSRIRLCYSIDGELSENYKLEFFVRGKRVDPIHQTQNKGAKSVPCTEVVLPMPEIAREEVSVDIRIVDKNTKRKWIADEITLTYESVIKPTLHVFAVGISEYPVDDLDSLKYGAKDAQDFVNTINSLDLSQYKEVKQTLILNKDASANYVRTQLNKLANRVDHDDVVMLFFSGHGVNEDNKWYFMTYGIPANDCVNALDFDFIKDQMKRMSNDKNCHVLVFMDACHSGGMHGQKGNVPDITFSEAGINGFYSCSARKKSREENGNGLFTRALVDGIRGAADIDKGGSITISELREYITTALEKKGQSPVFDNPGGDYILFYKKQ